MKLVTLQRSMIFLSILKTIINFLLEKSSIKISAKLSQLNESEIYKNINSEIFSSNKINLSALLSSKPNNQQSSRQKLFNQNENKVQPQRNNTSLVDKHKEDSNPRLNQLPTNITLNYKRRKVIRYNSATRNKINKKKLRNEKILIKRNIAMNYSLTKNQTSIVNDADKRAKDPSKWDESFLGDLTNFFYPYKGVTLKTYLRILNQVKSNSNSRVSQPFFTILARTKNLFGKQIRKKMREEITRIRKMSIDQATDEIIRFGEKIKSSKDNEIIYWYYFNIVSEVILTGRLVYSKNNERYETKNWDISENSFNSKFNSGGKNRNLTDAPKQNKRLLEQGIDKNYDDLLLKDQKYMEVLEFYKLLTMNQLLNTELDSKIEKRYNQTKNHSNIERNSKNISHMEFLKKKNLKIKGRKLKFVRKVSSYNSSTQLEFKDLNFDIFLLEEIRKSFFYNELANFPKGVIHHLHWSAAFFMGDILTGVEKLIDENYQKKLITVIIKGKVYLKDRVRPDEFNEISSQRLLIIEDFISFLKDFYSGKFKSEVRKFKQNFILGDGRCLIEPISPPGPENYVSPSVMAYSIFTLCRDSILFSKVLDFNQIQNITFIDRKRVKPFSKLSSYLQIHSHILTPVKILKRFYLPKIYKDMLHTNKDRNSVTIWIKFESIFGIYADLLDNLNVFKYLNRMLLKELLEDKVIGVEFRQKHDLGKPNSLMEIMKNMTYEKVVHSKNSNETMYELAYFPVSFILPGRKVKDGHKLEKLSAALEISKKLKDEFTVGFDFFGYEDDPFTGARNFFPFTLRKFNDLTHSPPISNFDQIFNKAENQKNEKNNTNKNVQKKNDFAFFLEMLRKGHKLFLHAGETLYFPNYPVGRRFLKKFYINDNLIHAALLPNVERLGHGFAAGRNDLLMNIYRRKNISLEICPVSNQALLYHQVSDNPLTRLLREGVSVTISPDDPGLFFYSGVRMDWFYLIMQTDLLPSEYYILIRNSIVRSSIKEINNNAQKYLDEAKLQIEKFFNSEKYHIIRKNFPDNQELKNYLQLGKHSGIKYKENRNTKKQKTEFNIYDFDNLVQESKKMNSLE